MSNNFINKIIDKDLALGSYSHVNTRFSPEPNGYLHIGHAKAICLNFGIAAYYNGKCNLRFDDTNPIHENVKYIDAIKKDIRWLGFNWDRNIYYASNYFDKLYSYACELINKGLAYVDELSLNEVRNYRGTLTMPGKNSPYRNRDIKENLNLFTKMRMGGFVEGSACLRAKIDMNSPFIVMRDPVLYRIKFVDHHQTGNKWCIYPTYDFTHCISDALEDVTHSLCTLEFQDNRRLYNWILDNISIDKHPHQHEFSRLNMEYTILSKRKLNIIIKEKIVDGWDDPRMPTISGLRRRGYTAAAIRNFCQLIGVTKQENNIQITTLESCIRKDLNDKAPRVMAVINPIKLIIMNLPKEHKEHIIVPNHPNKPEMGTRKMIFTQEIMIDQDDFREQNDDNTYKRLVLGKKVRLRHAYVIQAEHLKKDVQGNIIAIFCRYDPDTLNTHLFKYHEIKGIIHWVSAINNIAAEFRLYDHLFNNINPSSMSNFLSAINPDSLTVRYGFIESEALIIKCKKYYQFEREGFFYLDDKYSNISRPVFNRIVSLRNTWTNKSRIKTR